MSDTSTDARHQAIEDDWQLEHERHPGTAKATYVRNCLFNGKFSFSDLGWWVLSQDDLADQIWEGGSNGYQRMVKTHTDEDGRDWFSADPNGPRVIVRVQMETLREGGESKLLKREKPSWGDWDD